MSSSLATYDDPSAGSDAVEPALQPFRIGPLTLRNRTVVAPMSRVSAGRGGIATRQMAEYYASFARGGFALVVTEGIYPDTEFAQGYEHQPGLATGEQQRGWQTVTDAVHEAGTPILAQLMHAGALSQCLPRTVAPSAVTPRGRKMPDYGGNGPFPTPQAMTREQIDTVRSGFAAAARRAWAAGFDGVEVHAANGYLLDQFITTYTNQRTDEYGEGPLGRIRLTAEVLSDIRAAVPADFVVGVRLSQTKVNDLTYRWSGVSEAAAYFAAVARAGVDYIHVASEGSNWYETAMLTAEESITGVARAVTGLPVLANGGLHVPELARAVLTEGHADAIALGTGALANPDWPHRLRDGRAFAQFDARILHPSASLDNAAAVLAKLQEGESA